MSALCTGDMDPEITNGRRRMSASESESEDFESDSDPAASAPHRKLPHYTSWDGLRYYEPRLMNTFACNEAGRQEAWKLRANYE